MAQRIEESFFSLFTTFWRTKYDFWEIFILVEKALKEWKWRSGNWKERDFEEITHRLSPFSFVIIPLWKREEKNWVNWHENSLHPMIGTQKVGIPIFFSTHFEGKLDSLPFKRHQLQLFPQWNLQHHHLTYHWRLYIFCYWILQFRTKTCLMEFLKTHHESESSISGRFLCCPKSWVHVRKNWINMKVARFFNINC